MVLQAPLPDQQNKTCDLYRRIEGNRPSLGMPTYEKLYENYIHFSRHFLQEVRPFILSSLFSNNNERGGN